MKTGDVVRQLATDGNPIGSYYKVVKVRGNKVYCKKFVNGRTVFQDTQYTFRKERLVVQSKIFLNITGDEADMLFFTHSPVYVLQHPLSKSWEAAAKEKPDVLELAHRASGITEYISYEKIEKIVRCTKDKQLLFVRITGITFLS